MERPERLERSERLERLDRLERPEGLERREKLDEPWRLERSRRLQNWSDTLRQFVMAVVAPRGRAGAIGKWKHLTVLLMPCVAQQTPNWQFAFFKREALRFVRVAFPHEAVASLGLCQFESSGTTTSNVYGGFPWKKLSLQPALGHHAAWCLFSFQGGVHTCCQKTCMRSVSICIYIYIHIYIYVFAHIGQKCILS